MDSTSALSLAGSAFSTVCTAYFWLVRMKRERPQLSPFVIDREFFLGGMTAQSRQIGFKVGLVVANYSVLPNAVLGAGVALYGKECGFQEIAPVTFDKQTPLPLNVPSLQTVLLRLQGNLTFPYTDALEQGSKTVGAYLERFLANPWRLRLELHNLNKRRDVFDLPLALPAVKAAA
jgi:hypothetical protein